MSENSSNIQLIRESYIQELDRALAEYKQKCFKISENAKMEIKSQGENANVQPILAEQKSQLALAYAELAEKMKSVKMTFFKEMDGLSRKIEEANIHELERLIDQM